MKTLPPALRTLIVDDERLARKLLSEMLQSHAGIEVVGEASSVEEAVPLAARHLPHVVFLDVQMPLQSGFELLPFLGRLAVQPLVVFVTAHDEYAVRAFESAALDYLLKPVHPDRLARTVERLLLAAAAFPTPAAQPDQAREKSAPSQMVARLGAEDVEVLRDGRSIRLVRPSQIRAIQTEGSYTRLLLDSDSSSMVKLPLSYWEQRLPDGLFFKASRSMLINLACAREMQTHSRERTHLFLAGVSLPLILSRLESLRLRREIHRSG
jgi:two-component system LytT family response regulator